MASPVLAFMAGLGQGYVGAKNKEADNERRDRLDKILTDRADREAKEFARMETERKERSDAVADIKPVSGEVFMPTHDDEGNVMPANPTAGSFKVGDQRFATMGEATKAAQTQNSPEARNDRLLAVMQRQDPVRAQQFQATLMQGKAAGLQLEQAQMDLANRKFDEALSGLDSHEAIAQATGQLGANLQARPGANGKIEYWRVGADGQAVKTPYSFDNSPEGVAQAKLALSKATPLASKIEFAWRREQAARDQNNADRDFGLRQEAQTSLEGYRSASLNLDRQRLGIQQAAAAAEAKIPAAVRLQFGGYEKQLQTVASAIAKAQAEGMFDPASPGAQSLLAQQAILTRKMADLMSPYVGGSKQGADPLGLFKDGPAKDGAAVGSSQAAGSSQQSGGTPGSATPPQAATEPGAVQKAIATMTGRRSLFDAPSAEGPAAAQLAAARDATRQARAALQAFGQRQRAQDPQGYERAKAALAQAQAAERQALAAYQRGISTRDMATMQ